MHKLRLDDLAVESFDVAGLGWVGIRGTVRGHSGEATCVGDWTYRVGDHTCAMDCGGLTGGPELSCHETTTNTGPVSQGCDDGTGGATLAISCTCNNTTYSE